MVVVCNPRRLVPRQPHGSVNIDVAMHKRGDPDIVFRMRKNGRHEISLFLEVSPRRKTFFELALGKCFSKLHSENFQLIGCVNETRMDGDGDPLFGCFYFRRYRYLFPGRLCPSSSKSVFWRRILLEEILYNHSENPEPRQLDSGDFIRLEQDFTWAIHPAFPADWQYRIFVVVVQIT